MLFIPFITLLLNESLKVIIQSIKNRKLMLCWFLHAGGMPSGHSAFVASIATVVGAMTGYNSAEFLITLGFVVIVMYDARGVRRVVGRHADVLNKLDKKAKLETPVGHTNFEVLVGGVFGVVVSLALISVISK